ncbi:MAG: hypothetical protein Q4P06_09260 [Actinomycetaceae bacterium]|nr:hypothetical protein [Actinomycetaceae bacterium]
MTPRNDHNQAGQRPRRPGLPTPSAPQGKRETPKRGGRKSEGKARKPSAPTPVAGREQKKSKWSPIGRGQGKKRETTANPAAVGKTAAPRPRKGGGGIRNGVAAARKGAGGAAASIRKGTGGAGAAPRKGAAVPRKGPTAAAASLKQTPDARPGIWAIVLSRTFIKGVLVTLAIVVVIAGGYNIYRAFNSALVSLRTKPAHVGVGGVAPPIVACNLKDLNLEFVGPPTSIKPNTPWSSTLRVTNQGNAHCTYDGSLKSLYVNVKSGDVPTATLDGCYAETEDLPLLFSPGQKWETTLGWNGTHTSDCTSGKYAEPGTYVITLMANGEPTETSVVLTVVDDTPTPTPTPAPTTE